MVKLSVSKPFVTDAIGRIEKAESIITQNAEEASIIFNKYQNGELIGQSYTFTGDSFTIGGMTGDIAKHTPTESKWIHSDGSYSRAYSGGLVRYDAATERKYHHITKVIKYSMGAISQAPTYRYIPLGEEFSKLDISEITVAHALSDSMQPPDNKYALQRMVATQGHDTSNNVLQPRFRNGQWEYPVTSYTMYVHQDLDRRMYSDIACILIVTA